MKRISSILNSFKSKIITIEGKKYYKCNQSDTCPRSIESDKITDKTSFLYKLIADFNNQKQYLVGNT